jgi:hypothetical protein
MRGVSFQHASCNAKLSQVLLKKHPNGRYQTATQAPYVCSTYVSIQATCPPSCRFKDYGCYAQMGIQDVVRRLDEAAQGMTGLQVAQAEAEVIDQAWSCRGIPQDGARGGRDLRLHVAGEFSGRKGARLVGQAAERWRARGGGQVWTYTHRWRQIQPSDFGPALTVLASVETHEEVEEAIEHGYVPLLAVRKFFTSRAYRVPTAGVKVIPCPAQTRHVKCIGCRLCFGKLSKGSVIAVQLHGVGAGKAARRIPLYGQTSLSF